MSWMQYLAVSRSFSSIENRPTRFRMRDEYLLPRFGGTQDSEESHESAAGPSESGQAEELKCAQVKGHAMQNKIAQRAPETPTTPQPANPGGRWRIWRNPFGHVSKAKAAETPVQTELRLDAVKVVRNDLTDSDLLLVAPPQRAGASKRDAGQTRRTDEKNRAGLLGRVQEFLAGF